MAPSRPAPSRPAPSRPAPSRPDARLVAGVAVGGVLGSLGRYAVGLALPWTGTGLPWATLVVNVVGACAMGVLVAYVAGHPEAPRWVQPVVGVGVLGGWTTYSAFAVEVTRLGEAGQAGGAAAYIVISFAATVLAVAAGCGVAQRIWRPR